ncbi:hypothetical protein [Mesorhizobium sp. B4-1-4]|uniref:hypothetical protein n=1 Tax=Mesorhizobium sp. B4-1-4 TaxID=2589888 RepID=UPI001129CEF7|nr:hypothetical protein [Mesorhizobium sp. B4-1-4]UCI32525.1 hypothetical protein FJW03_03460 [Mesorhizobium sp. B4-1-4]
MSRCVVIAKVLRREPKGTSSIDHSELWTTFFEEQAYTFTDDQPISAIFERINRIRSDVVEIRLADDGTNYPMRDEQGNLVY